MRWSLERQFILQQSTSAQSVCLLWLTPGATWRHRTLLAKLLVTWSMMLSSRYPLWVAFIFKTNSDCYFFKIKIITTCFFLLSTGFYYFLVSKIVRVLSSKFVNLLSYAIVFVFRWKPRARARPTWRNWPGRRSTSPFVTEWGPGRSRSLHSKALTRVRRLSSGSGKPSATGTSPWGSTRTRSYLSRFSPRWNTAT